MYFILIPGVEADLEVVPGSSCHPLQSSNSAFTAILPALRHPVVGGSNGPALSHRQESPHLQSPTTYPAPPPPDQPMGQPAPYGAHSFQQGKLGPVPQVALPEDAAAALFAPIFSHETAQPTDFPGYPGSSVSGGAACGGSADYADFLATESGSSQQQPDPDLSVLSSDLINRVLNLPYVVSYVSLECGA